MCECFRGKSQIVLLSTFDQRDKKKYIFWQKCVQCARKGKKCPFSHTVHIFVKIYIYFLDSKCGVMIPVLIKEMIF